MLTAHYLHCLPADYDLDAVRARGQRRGALWDAAPELDWRVSHYLLAEIPDARPAATAIAYEVVHLSQPLLHTLLNGGAA